ncbi:hypothetical protein [Oryza sativa Japonica Group]|uniref:Uncharacterized protein n=1 Tax=Oryza sativa subsp. japonica TaxID=39947 RepID=Q5NBD9_ORYSJ|nr:hypothetical protein [Oryza sativa Japonica Group]
MEPIPLGQAQRRQGQRYGLIEKIGSLGWPRAHGMLLEGSIVGSGPRTGGMLLEGSIVGSDPRAGSAQFKGI